MGLEVSPVIVLKGVLAAVVDPHWPLSAIRVVHLDVTDSTDPLVQFIKGAGL